MDISAMNFFQTKNNFAAIADKEASLIFGTRIPHPLLSIMITTYKRPFFLEQTIESAVHQKTGIQYEIVVVDNNDDVTDEATLDIVRKYGDSGICYYRNAENLGAIGNFNRCLELANADWVLILNDDDTLEPEYVEEMMKIAQARGQGMIACCHNMIDANSNELRPPLRERLLNQFLGNGKVLELSVKDFFFRHMVNVFGTLFNRQNAMDLGGV